MNTQKLSHSYGHSYFGSGGASGSVRYCNARSAGTGDNGFVCGTSAVAVIDPSLPARVFASGSDCIGEGRSWSEAWEYAPGTGWLRADLADSPSELPEGGQGRRGAWLIAGTAETAAALAEWHGVRAAREAARVAAYAVREATASAERAVAAVAAWHEEQARLDGVLAARAAEAAAHLHRQRGPARRRAGGAGRTL